MRRALLATAALAAAGCGSPSADLFELTRSGADKAANVRLVVSDGGTASCNGSEPKALPGGMLLDARELTRDLDKQAALSIELPAEKNSTLRYVVRTETGRVTFSDTSRGRPKSFDRMVAFSKNVIENVCAINR